jgi:hypothetical protein
LSSSSACTDQRFTHCALLVCPDACQCRYDALGHLIDPLQNAVTGWVSSKAPNGTELVVTLARRNEIKEEQAKAEEAKQKPWTDPQYALALLLCCSLALLLLCLTPPFPVCANRCEGTYMRASVTCLLNITVCVCVRVCACVAWHRYSDGAGHHINAQRLSAAAAAGRVAPRDTLPEEAHLSSLVNGLETPDENFSRLAAEQAEADRIEAERKAVLAAAAANSQAAKDRAAAAAAAEAERLRRIAEEAERKKPKRRIAGFDLIMKEQSGSHEYDHENAELIERPKEADAAGEEYAKMKEEEERRRKGMATP